MGLTHFTAAGDAQMVDVGAKPPSRRVALVSGRIRMQPETLALVRDGSHKKGDVLGIARIAGIMACKRAADLIPLCHPLPLSHVAVDFDYASDAVTCQVRCATTGPTGVEMEALIGCQTALATIYDMCKAVDRGMVIDAVQLEQKSGGRSGEWQRSAD